MIVVDGRPVTSYPGRQLIVLALPDVGFKRAHGADVDAQFTWWCEANDVPMQRICGTEIAVSATSINVRLYDLNAEGNLFRDADGGASQRGWRLPLIEPLPAALREHAATYPPVPEYAI